MPEKDHSFFLAMVVTVLRFSGCHHFTFCSRVIILIEKKGGKGEKTC